MIPFLVGLGTAVILGSAMSNQKKSSHVSEETYTREISEKDVPTDVLEVIKVQEEKLMQKKTVRKKNKKASRQNAGANKMLQIGYEFYHGQNGRKVNYLEARKYFQKAANFGNAEAKEMLNRLQW